MTDLISREAAIRELQHRKELLRSQLEALDIRREDAMYDLSIEAIRALSAHHIGDANKMGTATALIICDGCGSSLYEAELEALRATRPGTLSCCPERKMRPATREDWDKLRATLSSTQRTAPTVKPQPRPTFPILGGEGARIDLQLVIDHGGQAKRNHYQTVEQLAKRGGLSWSELHAVLHNKAFERIDPNTAILACRSLEAKYLATVAAPPTVKVKPLVWHGPDVNGDYHASTILETYHITATDGHGYWVSGVGGYFRDLEPAQAATQLHHDTRILSALERGAL